VPDLSSTLLSSFPFINDILYCLRREPFLLAFFVELYQWFVTDLASRPRSTLAISTHRLPSLLWASMKIFSSSSDQVRRSLGKRFSSSRFSMSATSALIFSIVARASSSSYAAGNPGGITAVSPGPSPPESQSPEAVPSFPSTGLASASRLCTVLGVPPSSPRTTSSCSSSKFLVTSSSLSLLVVKSSVSVSSSQSLPPPESEAELVLDPEPPPASATLPRLALGHSPCSSGVVSADDAGLFSANPASEASPNPSPSE